MTESVYKIALARIAAIIPYIPAAMLNERLKGDPDAGAASGVYTDSKGHAHVIREMPGGYLHNAAAKLRREGTAPATLQAMDLEIARRAAEDQRASGDPNPEG